MGFSKMIELLQAKEQGNIILVNAGNFYIARGKDAVLLHNLLDLKVSCVESEICKVGFPLNSLEKYTKLIEKKKFSIGTEYKTSMYEMLKNIMYLNKIEKEKYLEKLNNIDAELNTQRIYLRIMKKEKWIDEKKFKISMEQIYEIGKILGGIIKYYAKNNKK